MSEQKAFETLEAPKEQPWKAFWPPKTADYTEEQLAQMPWLTYTPDPEKPEPSYAWLQEETPEQTALPGYVCRSGSGGSPN